MQASTTHGGVGLSASTVAEEIDELLPLSKGQLGSVSKCIQSGITDRKAIVDEGAAANTGAVYNIERNIEAIRDGVIPDAPSMASGALSASRSFLKQHRSRLSPAAVAHLEIVIESLASAVADRSAQDREEEELQRKGTELEEALAVQGGVYVFTFPHYWRYPTVEDTRRTLLKIGMTSKDAGERVKQQARQTAVPEDPLLLRVYQSDTLEPRELEKTFHRLLIAADHTRAETSSAGGKEWFETSIEFLDTIAATLDLRVLDAEDD